MLHAIAKEKPFGGLAVVICVFIFGNGVPAIAEIGFFDFIFGTTWRPSNDLFGIAPMIVGSLYVMAGALIVGVPLGILCAIFLAYFGSYRVARIAKSGVQLLAGIPSVVYGFFGLVVLVRSFIRRRSAERSIDPLCLFGSRHHDPSTVITSIESAMKAVPSSYYEGALALGADHERCVLRVMVPAAVSGISPRSSSQSGRAIGDDGGHHGRGQPERRSLRPSPMAFAR